jgi:hypothetical protein
MESLRILRIWAGAAWADGKLVPAEAAALRRFVDHSDDLSADQKKEALSVLTSPPPFDTAEVRALPRYAREGVLRAAIGIVRVDRQVTSEEEAFLAKLRAALDLDEATVARIQGEKYPLPRETKGED